MAEAPQRVLMTADAIGGVWTYVVELARGLSDNGVSVLIAVMGGGLTDAKRGEIESLANLQIVTADYKLEWMDGPWDDVRRAGDWLLALAHEFRPDVVHLNGYAHASLPWHAPVVIVAHSCVLSWFEAVRGGSAPGEWDRYRAAVRSGLASADCVVAPSHSLLEAMQRLYGPLARTRVISNARSGAPSPSTAKEPLIFTAGRAWDDSKNLATLSAAASQITWPIYVAGDAVHPHGGTAHLSGLNLLGPLTPHQITTWYERAAIYAHPAVYEPFGLSVLEAARAGCALILSDIPSLREIWGDAAHFVAPREAHAWTRILNALKADPQAVHDFAARALRRALDFSAPAMTRRYLAIYEQARLHRSCALPSSAIPFGPTGTTETPISSAAS